MFPMKLVYSRPQRSGVSGPQIPNPPKPPLYMYPDHPLRYREINFVCFEMVFPKQMPYILRSLYSYTIFHPTNHHPTVISTGQIRGMKNHRSIPHLVPKQRSKELDLWRFRQEIHGEIACPMGFWFLDRFCVVFL